MKQIFFSAILPVVFFVACEIPMNPVSYGNKGFNPVRLTIGVPYQDKIVVLGQNYYVFKTGAAGRYASSYTIALTNVTSSRMDLYSRADFSGLVARAPEGWGEVTLSVDLNSSTTYFLVVTETGMLSAPDVLIKTDSFQLLVTGTPSAGQVAPPTFCPAAGTYVGAQTVTISTTTAGATIRYTTDGSSPTSTRGTLYSGPISVATSEMIKAIAYEFGWTNSTVATAAYTINYPWQTVGRAHFSAGQVDFTSLAIDPSGTLYVAYRDYANPYKATVMKYAGGSWQVVGMAGFSAQSACPSLAIDLSGTPYVAYPDAVINPKATVMKYASGSWQTVGAAGFSIATVGHTSLAIDSSGTPYVAYRDDGNSSKATVMKYASGSWQTVGTAGFSAGAAEYASLAIDSSGTPYVAYEDYGNGQKATVMKYAGGSWQVVGAAGFSAGEANYVSLAIDPSGTPYVVYQDCGNSQRATVMKYASGSWQTVGTAGFSAGAADWTSLGIDTSGTPYVAYRDYGNGYRATVMKCTDGSWQVVGMAGFSAGAAAYTSLALDSLGTPYVAYEDYGNGYGATVMKYAGESW